MKLVNSIPPADILQKYADIMVNFAVNNGKGVQKGHNVLLRTQTVGIPLAKEVYKSIIRAGGNAFLDIKDEDFSLIGYQMSSDEQLSYVPMDLYKGMAKTIDCSIKIFGDVNPKLLKDCDPKKIMLSNKAGKPYNDLLEKKENDGKYSWTLCCYPTEGMAKEAGMTLSQYWDHIAEACFLNEKDPIKKWKWVMKEQQRIQKKLNSMPIDKIHIEGKDVDLWVTLGDERRWQSGCGANIPSFELFTSPDYRGTSGYVKFDLPLYCYGNIMRDIFLRFEDGKVVEFSASENEDFLSEMIAQEGMKSIGEFSLTDKRFSNISTFMAETLFDENFGGKYGNFHIALGESYPETYSGDVSSMTKQKKKKLGFNDAVDHVDIISKSNRKVTVILKDGKEKLLYKDGEFAI